MQQIINFDISVEKGFKKIQDRIKTLVFSYSFETAFSQEETEKRVKNWAKGIQFYPSKEGDAGEIRSFSEEQMYVFDYEVLFPTLFEDIAESCPDSEFYGHSEYYNDDCGVMEHHDIKYVDGQLKNGKKDKKKGALKYQNKASSEIVEGKPDLSFSYERIDEISNAIYGGAEFDDSSAPDDEVHTVEYGNLTVSINISVSKDVNRIISEYKNSFSGKDLEYPLYDPFFAISALGPGLEMFGVIEQARRELSNSQIAHRTRLFLKAVAKLAEEKTLRTIIGFAPKKKNGTLYAKRVTPIAALFCMDQNAKVYLLRAKAESSEALTIEIVHSVCTDMKIFDSDVLSKSDFYRTE